MRRYLTKPAPEGAGRPGWHTDKDYTPDPKFTMKRLPLPKDADVTCYTQDPVNYKKPHKFSEYGNCVFCGRWRSDTDGERRGVVHPDRQAED